MWKIASIAAAVVLLIAQPAFADQNEFCAGFVEGYQSVKGDKAVVPSCPSAPATPNGSTPFREGLKVGIRAARKK